MLGTSLPRGMTSVYQDQSDPDLQLMVQKTATLFSAYMNCSFRTHEQVNHCCAGSTSGWEQTPIGENSDICSTVARYMLKKT